MARMAIKRRTFLGILAALMPASSPLCANRRSGIALDFWADTIGDQDGIAQKNEQADLESTLKKTGSFYILTTGPERNFAVFSGKNYIFPTESVFRQAYRELDVQKEVGILNVGSSGEIIGAFSAKGKISESNWALAKRPDFNYANEMARRRDKNYNSRTELA